MAVIGESIGDRSRRCLLTATKRGQRTETRDDRQCETFCALHLMCSACRQYHRRESWRHRAGRCVWRHPPPQRHQQIQLNHLLHGLAHAYSHFYGRCRIVHQTVKYYMYIPRSLGLHVNIYTFRLHFQYIAVFRKTLAFAFSIRFIRIVCLRLRKLGFY